jgi:hypothetical protein
VERETWRVYFAQMAAQQKREQRQEEKRQIAHEIAVLKAMQKAGLSIRRAVGSTGLAVEIGQPVGTETTPSLTPSIPHARKGAKMGWFPARTCDHSIKVELAGSLSPAAKSR